jgi:hypothetical protein
MSVDFIDREFIRKANTTITMKMTVTNCRKVVSRVRGFARDNDDKSTKGVEEEDEGAAIVGGDTGTTLDDPVINDGVPDSIFPRRCMVVTIIYENARFSSKFKSLLETVFCSGVVLVLFWIK